MLTGSMRLNVSVKRTETGGDTQDEQATKVCAESHSPIVPVGPQNAGSQAYLEPQEPGGGAPPHPTAPQERPLSVGAGRLADAPQRNPPADSATTQNCETRRDCEGSLLDTKTGGEYWALEKVSHVKNTETFKKEPQETGTKQGQQYERL